MASGSEEHERLLDFEEAVYEEVYPQVVLSRHRQGERASPASARSSLLTVVEEYGAPALELPRVHVKK